MGRAEITPHNFQKLEDCQYDEKAQTKKWSNPVFAHMAVGTFHKFRKETRAGAAKWYDSQRRVRAQGKVET